MRTSFELQSVVYQFPVSQILVPQLYTTLLCCTRPDHDAPFQRDTCDHSMCKGSDMHQFFLFYLVVSASVAIWCGSVWNLACSESSSLISCFHTWCHRAQHISLRTLLLKTTLKWLQVVDWQTVVDSSGTSDLWTGRAVGIQGFETQEENPQTIRQGSIANTEATRGRRAKFQQKEASNRSPTQRMPRNLADVDHVSVNVVCGWRNQR